MRQKFQFFILAAFLLLSASCAQENPTLSCEEQQAIRANVESHADYFNLGSIAHLSSLWDEEGFYLNLGSEKLVEGKDNLMDYFKQLFQQGASIDYQIAKIKSLGQNKALVEGLYTLSFHSWPSTGSFLAEYEKKKGKWVISSLSVRNLTTPASNYEQLKELSWLTGQWKEEESPSRIEFANIWGKNKNFLSINSTYHVFGEEEMSFTEIIGFDPIDKKIHSWIFDSYGGFGESVWSNEDGKWVVPMVYVLPKGGEASAVYHYEKLDAHTFLLLINERRAEGKALPDLGPWKIIRKQ